MADNTNVAAKAPVETVEAKLARLERENAELKAQAALVPAQGKFALGITTARAAGTNGPNDAGAKGGSLRVSLGKQNVYPTKAMVLAILEHADEVKAFITGHATELTR